jgi:hypothetical protein
MRLTTCPDCGEAVELPLSESDVDVEVTCQICGLAAPVEEWRQYETEENDTLLGRNLADATIPASVPKRWALRYEQLEDIREVVVELQHQIRLLRQALDELNEDLPERIQRWFEAWHQECLPVEEIVNAVVASLPVTATSPPPASKSRAAKSPRADSSSAKSQNGLW